MRKLLLALLVALVATGAFPQTITGSESPTATPISGPLRSAWVPLAGDDKMISVADLDGAFVKSITTAGLATVQLADNSEVEVQLNLSGATVSREDVEDYVGALIAAGTQTGITVTYVDNDGNAGALNFTVAAGGTVTLSDDDPEEIAEDSTEGTSTEVSRADHVHGGALQFDTDAPEEVTTGSSVVGSSDEVSRSDHVHGGDTVRAFDPAEPANVATGTGTAGVRTTVARSDHVHGGDSTLTLSDSAPQDVVTGTGSAGTGNEAAREDHVHGGDRVGTGGGGNSNLSDANPQPMARTPAAGTATEASRDDHVHAGQTSSLTDMPTAFEARQMLVRNAGNNAFESVDQPNPIDTIPEVAELPDGSLASSPPAVLLPFSYTEGAQQNPTMNVGTDGTEVGYSDGTVLSDDYGTVTVDSPLNAMLGAGAINNYSISTVVSSHEEWINEFTHVLIADTEYALGDTFVSLGAFERRIMNHPTGLTTSGFQFNFKRADGTWWFTDGANEDVDAGLYVKIDGGYEIVTSRGVDHIDGFGEPEFEPTHAAQVYVDNAGDIWVSGDEIQAVTNPPTIVYVGFSDEYYLQAATTYAAFISNDSDGDFVWFESGFIQNRGDVIVGTTWMAAWDYINGIDPSTEHEQYRDDYVFLGSFDSVANAALARDQQTDASKTYLFLLHVPGDVQAQIILRQISSYTASSTTTIDHFFWDGPKLDSEDAIEIIGNTIVANPTTGVATQNLRLLEANGVIYNAESVIHADPTTGNLRAPTDLDWDATNNRSRNVAWDGNEFLKAERYFMGAHSADAVFTEVPLLTTFTHEGRTYRWRGEIHDAFPNINQQDGDFYFWPAGNRLREWVAAQNNWNDRNGAYPLNEAINYAGYYINQTIALGHISGNGQRVIYNQFPERARGVARFEGTENTAIPLGTRFSATVAGADVLFETIEVGVIPAVGMVDLDSRAVTGGSNGNVADETAFTLSTAITGVTSVAAEGAFTRGDDRSGGRYLYTVSGYVAPSADEYSYRWVAANTVIQGQVDLVGPDSGSGILRQPRATDYDVLHGQSEVIGFDGRNLYRAKRTLVTVDGPADADFTAVAGGATLVISDGRTNTNYRFRGVHYQDYEIHSPEDNDMYLNIHQGIPQFRHYDDSFPEGARWNDLTVSTINGFRWRGWFSTEHEALAHVTGNNQYVGYGFSVFLTSNFTSGDTDHYEYEWEAMFPPNQGLDPSDQSILDILHEREPDDTTLTVGDVGQGGTLLGWDDDNSVGSIADEGELDDDILIIGYFTSDYPFEISGHNVENRLYMEVEEACGNEKYDEAMVHWTDPDDDEADEYQFQPLNCLTDFTPNRQRYWSTGTISYRPDDGDTVSFNLENPDREDIELFGGVPWQWHVARGSGGGDGTTLADNSVTTAKIQNGAVTEPKLADDAVSPRTISATGSTDGQVLTSTGPTTSPAWETLTAGDITSVVAGAALSGGGTTGDVTLNLNIEALDALGTFIPTDDLVVNEAGTLRKGQIGLFADWVAAQIDDGTTITESGGLLSVSGFLPLAGGNLTGALDITHSGGTALEVERTDAGTVLHIDGSDAGNATLMQITTPSTGGKGFGVVRDGEGLDWVQFRYDASGANTPGIQLGSGTTGRDVTLYRSAANVLRTDDTFQANILAVDAAGLTQTQTNLGISDDQTATEVAVTASGFDGSLSTSATTVQAALQEIDDLTITGTDDQTAAEVSLSTTAFDRLLDSTDTNVQSLADAFDDLPGGIVQYSSTVTFTPATFLINAAVEIFTVAGDLVVFETPSNLDSSTSNLVMRTQVGTAFSANREVLDVDGDNVSASQLVAERIYTVVHIGNNWYLIDPLPAASSGGRSVVNVFDDQSLAATEAEAQVWHTNDFSSDISTYDDEDEIRFEVTVASGITTHTFPLRLWKNLTAIASTADEQSTPNKSSSNSIYFHIERTIDIGLSSHNANSFSIGRVDGDTFIWAHSDTNTVITGIRVDIIDW